MTGAPMTAVFTPPAIDDDTSRRQFLIGGLSLAGMIADFGTTAPAPGATPDVGGGFPVTIDHQFGSTTIARLPERWSASG